MKYTRLAKYVVRLGRKPPYFLGVSSMTVTADHDEGQPLRFEVEWVSASDGWAEAEFHSNYLFRGIYKLHENPLFLSLGYAALGIWDLYLEQLSKTPEVIDVIMTFDEIGDGAGNRDRTHAQHLARVAASQRAAQSALAEIAAEFLR